jgi:hypothetical protein
MRQKTLIALAIVTVPVLGLAIFLPSHRGTAMRQAETGPVFPTLKDWLSGATKLTVTAADGKTVTLTRTPPAQAPAGETVPLSGWGLAGKSNYPIQESVLRPILSGLLALHTTEPKTENKSLYDRIDVDDPATSKESKAKLLGLDNASGASILKLIVGRRKYDALAGGGDAIYIRKPEDERVWLAQPAFDLPTDEMGWIDHKILDVESDKIKSITITAGSDKPLVLERAKAEDTLAIRDLPKDATTRSETPGADVAAGFRYLDMLDVRPAAQVTGTPAETDEVVTFDGLDLTVSIYTQPEGGPWLEIAAKGEGDAAKAAEEIVNRTKGWAYKVPPSRERLLESKLADLLTPPPQKPVQSKPEDAPNPAADQPAKPTRRPGK